MKRDWKAASRTICDMVKTRGGGLVILDEEASGTFTLDRFDPDARVSTMSLETFTPKRVRQWLWEHGRRGANSKDVFIWARSLQGGQVCVGYGIVRPPTGGQEAG